MNENIYISVVIPAYNEEQRISETLTKLRKFLDEQSYAYEVLVINDGSTDTTNAIVDNTARVWPQLKLLSNSANRGKGAVVRQGILSAQGQYILFSDADNATPINQVDKLLQDIGKYPVVIGSRYCPGANIVVPQAWYRIWLSRLSNRLIRLILLPGIYDTQCGFKLFQNQPAKEIFSRVTINRFGFDFEALAIAHYLKYSFKEVGIDWSNDSASKVRAGRDAVRTLKDLFKVKRNLWRGVYEKRGQLHSCHPELTKLSLLCHPAKPAIMSGEAHAKTEAFGRRRGLLVQDLISDSGVAPWESSPAYRQAGQNDGREVRNDGEKELVEKISN